MQGTVCVFIILFYQANAISSLVQISQGLVRGVRSEDGEYFMFMGIPFAQVDPKRPFGNPIAAPKFSTIFQANDDSAICLQVEELNNVIKGNIDCLYINVYVPSKASSTNRLPVMIWIYGGAFSFGIAGRFNYGPGFLVKHNVILITFNYRVGVFGFMCLGTEDVPGNAGFKDQLAALRWVKKNIRSFGGDDENITIFGESSGSLSVELHLLFHGDEGLFNRCILQSSSSILGISDQPDSSKLLKISHYLGKSTKDTDKALQYLSYFSPRDIVKAVDDLDLSFTGCIENQLNNVEPFMTKSAQEVISSGNYSQVPLIMGLVELEGLPEIIVKTRSDPNYLKNYEFNIHNVINSRVQNINPEKLKTVIKTTSHFYLKNKSFDDNILLEIAEFYGDIYFSHPVERSMSYHLLNSNPVYFYVFWFIGSRNYVKHRANITIGGACHGDEIAYLFEQSYYTAKTSPEEQKVIDSITTLWTNFAKYGNPTPKGTNLPHWPPITATTRPAMKIDKELQIVKRPFARRLAYWDIIYAVFEGYNPK